MRTQKLYNVFSTLKQHDPVVLYVVPNIIFFLSSQHQKVLQMVQKADQAQGSQKIIK